MPGRLVKGPAVEDPQRFPHLNGSGVEAGEQGSLPSACQEAIDHLRRAIVGGQSWALALLEAIGLWTLPQEVYRGRLCRYLIRGEAFDWLLLARRLSDTVVDLVPAAQRRQLLREGRLPREVSRDEFQRCLGVAKSRAYLNYWYGVTVEAALQETVRAEVRKERLSWGLSPKHRATEEAFRRIYGEGRALLLAKFLQSQEKPPVPLASGGFLKGFTYWLFKLRLEHCEKARVASDTLKALQWLQHHHPEAFLWPASPPEVEAGLNEIFPGQQARDEWR